MNAVEFRGARMADHVRINRKHVMEADWMRINMIMLKAAYKREGLHRHFARLLKEYYPGLYETKADYMRLRNIWNCAVIDEVVYNRLADILEKEKVK